MRRTPRLLKIRLIRSLNTSSPFGPFSILPTVIGPVWRQAIEALDGSSNQLPLVSRSRMPRLKWARWHVTPCTSGSSIASTTTPLPVQSFVKLPTSSARTGPGPVAAKKVRAAARRRMVRTCLSVAEVGARARDAFSHAQAKYWWRRIALQQPSRGIYHWATCSQQIEQRHTDGRRRTTQEEPKKYRGR